MVSEFICSHLPLRIRRDDLWQAAASSINNKTVAIKSNNIDSRSSQNSFITNYRESSFITRIISV